MKSLMTAVSLMIASAAMAQSRAVTHIDSEKVGAALAGARGVVGSLVATKDFTVSGIKRTTPGQVEIHDHETDIFYVTDGEATFVTGGTIVGGKQTAPGQTRGTDLHG
jgi:mannose-6-phosphate isomerase-like protein (cupin superfamily)